MKESILTSVKKCINGIPEENEDFDEDILVFINSQFSKLNQIGYGPENGFSIVDKSSKWSDYITDERFNFVKEYIITSVRIRFCPPESSFVLNELKSELDELTFRINVAAEQLNS